MYILGDIGNSETKVFLLNTNEKVIKSINFPSKQINNKILNHKFKYLIKDFKSIDKILFCSVVPKTFNLIKKFLSKKIRKKCYEVKDLKLRSLINIKVNYNQVGSDRLTNAISLLNDKDNFIITTIGQLNFFKWAITNKIINYVIENHKMINDEMNRMNKINKKTFKSVKVSKEVKNERLMNILDTTINFNGGQKQLKVKTTLYDNEEYNIAKLEFDK